MSGYSVRSRPAARWGGITVTLREQRTGKRHTLAVEGDPREALEAVVDAIDRVREDWRILCYSTPQTILRDLTGPPRFETPEVAALAALGRLDRLDPEIRRC